MLRAIAARAQCLGGKIGAPSDPRIRLLLTALVVAAAYYFGALFSFTLRVPSTRSSIIWAPNAVLLAALVTTPPKTWWIWLVAALPAHLMAQSRDAAPVLILLCPFLANVAQAVLAAAGLRRLTTPPHRLATLRDMAVFILIAVVAVPAVVSFAAAWLFVAAGWETDYWTVALARLLNNIVTGLTVAPLCLAIAGGDLVQLRRLSIGRYAEFAVVLLGLVGMLSIASGSEAWETSTFPTRLHLALLFLIWAAVRFSPAGLSIALLIVAYDSIADSITGQALFADGSPVRDVLALEASLGILSFPLMLLAALIQERNSKETALLQSEERLARTEQFSLIMVTHTDLDGRWIKVPSTLCDLLGYSQEELLGRDFAELTHPDDREAHAHERERLVAGEIKSFDIEKRYIRKDGGIVWVYINVTLVTDTDGSPIHCLSYIRDISNRKRAEALRIGQSRVLELIAVNAPLRDVLSELARFVESQANGLRCSILLLDEDGVRMRHAAAPSLPESYVEAVEGLAIGSKAGSCGTAMYPPTSVIVTDTTKDPLWEEYREVASTYDLRACWSTPIRSSMGKVLGSFTIYADQPRSPTREESQLINIATRLAGIGIEGHRAQQAVLNSEERLQLALDSGGMGIWDWDRRTDLVQWSRQHYTMMGLLPDSLTPTYKLWEERVHPEDLPRVRGELKRSIAERANFRSEYRVILDGGIHRWVTSRGEPIYGADGECVRMTGITVETTDRKHAEFRLNLQHQITRVLSECGSLADAARPLIRTICDCFDWHYGELWQINSNAKVLSFLDAYPYSEEFAEFIAVSRDLTPEPGMGLPGRVWESGGPAWISSIPSPVHSGRAELAKAAGFASAFSFPITAGTRILGVMAFFSRYTREPDPDLLQVVHSIGGQIGQFLERKQAERALRASEERNRAILESALDSIITVDERGSIVEFNPAAERTFGHKRSYALGKRVGALIAPPAQHNLGLVHFLTSGLPAILDKRLETTAMRSDGLEFPIELTVTRIAMDGPPMFTGYIRDITERKRREGALSDAVAEVQRLKQQVEADNLYLREELSEAHRDGEIVGKSDALKKVLRQVQQVAATDMTVLILGETGTGKELVARAIHERSARKQRPLVKVNCSALPAELMESELFGYEKGAFTGATAKRVGRFELADGGTIFLDEIGDLGLSLQSKLLRVLQEGEFERLGSSKTIHVNVRVIAATNRDLSDAMRKELFRSDLYYRLAVYPIQMPPLRERKEDIKLLAQSFLEEASRRLGRSFEAIPPRVLEALEHYDWPGNVRELQNVMERAAVTSTGRFLQLPEEWHPESQASAVNAQNTVFEQGARPRDANLESLERAHIFQVLTQTRWRIEGPKGAATILGLRPSTLRSRMQKLGISRSDRLEV